MIKRLKPKSIRRRVKKIVPKKKRVATRTLDQLSKDLAGLEQLEKEEKERKKAQGRINLATGKLVTKDKPGEEKKAPKTAVTAPGEDEVDEDGNIIKPGQKGKKGKGKGKKNSEFDSSSQKSSAIAILDLSFNCIGPDGAKSIGSALQSNSSIVRMILTNNQFNDESMETVFTAMQVNTSIKELIVNNCGLVRRLLKHLDRR